VLPRGPLVSTSAHGQRLSEDEFKVELRRQQLEGGEIYLAGQEFDLVRQRVLLGLMVVFAITTVACALVGTHWPVPTTTGGVTGWIASVVEGRRANDNP
jgi:hypothetical protein